jgi:hypothetical protein
MPKTPLQRLGGGEHLGRRRAIIGRRHARQARHTGRRSRSAPSRRDVQVSFQRHCKNGRVTEEDFIAVEEDVDLKNAVFA